MDEIVLTTDDGTEFLIHVTTRHSAITGADSGWEAKINLVISGGDHTQAEAITALKALALKLSGATEPE